MKVVAKAGIIFFIVINFIEINRICFDLWLNQAAAFFRK